MFTNLAQKGAVMGKNTPGLSGTRETARHPRPDTHTATEGAPRWHLPVGALAIAALAMVGVIFFFYPSTAAWLSQYDQSKVVVSLSEASDEVTPAHRENALAAAREYNDELVSGAFLSSNSRKPIAAPGEPESDALYQSLLHGDANGGMGRLRIDAIDVDLPIYHGTDDETLAKGVGHLQGTSLPVGGPSTHSVLTAHRGLAGSTLFDRLNELGIGDRFRVEVFGEVLTYQIVATRVVEPENTESLFPHFEKDLVTLVTCTPLGINSHRILVTGERVLPTPIVDVQQAGAGPNVPGAPWWAAGLLGSLSLLGIYVWRAGRPRKAAKAAASRGKSTAEHRARRSGLNAP